MIWTKWLPLRYIIRRAARSQGFLDPIELMARLRRFAQPSEVAEPVELLRAGVVFHARGLINSKVIQHNLDWVWPYWIERQFDPHDASFIPRAFSFSHINLTHRNWTAVGCPDVEELPLLDPRGLLTPLFDGWSLDAWVLAEDGRRLLPSRSPQCEQVQEMDEGLAIVTRCRDGGLALSQRAEVIVENGEPICRLELEASADGKAWLALALRPHNAEGISFIHEVALSPDRRSWRVEDGQRVEFSQPAERHHVSDYAHGDVSFDILQRADRPKGSCEVGLVTAAALFPVQAGAAAKLQARIPLPQETPHSGRYPAWRDLRERSCKLRCPEPAWQFLYDAAVSSLLLHSPHDVYPGPYTYKRFWFRDAAFLIHALLCLGLLDRAERALRRFPDRQTPLGYFRSQEGEWDSNGEVLWILRRFRELTGRPLPRAWDHPIQRGARWIMRKRLDEDLDAPHAGLLPAGFSAEHLGPNDYYYWDDFWCIAGLEAAAALTRERDPQAADSFEREARNFAACVDRSLAGCARRLGRPGMPASPYRRLDAGAIGSLAAGYPLQYYRPHDPRLLDCAEFLLDKCFVHGAFFQDMIHSGLNAYLTLHVAQVLLRAGDPRYLDLMDTVARIATPTGQWPEAIHPHTMGGCMGDGHHVWASAEWVLMIRNCFVREEGDTLIIGAGIPRRWLDRGEEITFGPAPTSFGSVHVSVVPAGDGRVEVRWRGQWHRETPPIEVRLPGCKPAAVDRDMTSISLFREENSA